MSIDNITNIDTSFIRSNTLKGKLHIFKAPEQTTSLNKDKNLKETDNAIKKDSN